MTGDDDALLPGLEHERLLAQIKGAYLEGLGKGRLSLTNKRVEFEHRSGLLSPYVVEFSADLSRIFSAKTGDEPNTLTLEWLDDRGTPVVRELTLPEGDAAQRLSRILSDRLRALREDAALREQDALHRAYLWTAAYHAWLTARLLGRIVEGLMGQDWDTVEATSAETIAAAANLPGSVAAELTRSLDNLAHNVASRDAPLALRDVVAIHSAIGQSLNTEGPPDDRWATTSVTTSGGLVWHHIRYVFLFTAWHCLLSNPQHSGDPAATEEATSRLSRMLTVLASGISSELQPGRSSRGRHSTDGLDAIDSAARNLEALLKINAGVA
jgi:hypothetical protein